AEGGSGGGSNVGGGTAEGGTGGGGSGNNCDSCMESKCGNEISACENDAQCTGLLSCFDNCEDMDCMEKCVNDNPSGAALLKNVFDCMDKNCQAECADE
ncbi:MAG TPA: hypothetical protein PLH51_20655, partial [Polyangiaceae bacterium]|nr:hypothetical protein [Polyangiaceae bacterium]